MRKSFLSVSLFLLCIASTTARAEISSLQPPTPVVTLNTQDQTVEDVLKAIEKQTNLSFFFNNKHINLNRRVSVSVNGEDVTKVLDNLFAGTNVRYQIVDRKIVLSVNDVTQQQQSKQITVTGRVLDTSGEPIIGGSIVEKGAATNGTITDIDGNFTLTVSAGATLVVTYVGYQTQEKKAVAGQPMKITMTDDAKQLEEVVVVGYGVQKKRDLTGAVASVKMNDEPVNTFSTVSHALAGKAAGLQVVQNSAQPGASAKFRIRGEGSIDGGNSPLVVIDGFPVNSRSNADSGNQYDDGDVDNVLASLNPNDIESIEVLKDASSAAIYGSRAGHGVIIITTKRGSRAEKTKVSYSGTVSFQSMRDNYKMLGGQEFMRERNREEYEKYLYANAMDIYADYKSKPVDENGNPKHIDLVVPYSDAQIAAAQTTDWLGAVTRTGIQHSHNVSLTGGSEKTNYMASINYFSQEGVIKNNGTERFTGKFNGDYEISKYVKTGISLNMSRNTYDNVPLGDGGNEVSGVISSALRYAPYTPIYDENGNFSQNPFLSTIPNPVALLTITDKTIVDRMMGSGFIQINPIKELTIRMSAGFDRGYQKRKQYVPSTLPYGKDKDGRADIHQSDYMDYLSNVTVNYMKDFGNHSLNALVGYEWQQFNSESLYAGNQKFPNDNFLYNNLGAGAYASPSVGSGANKKTMVSWFGRVNYSYLGRYLLTATVRADANSDFTKGHQWGYFPSVSAAWRFSDEKFMQGAASWLSNGKLRLSYGQTGNSDIGYYRFDAFQSSGSFIYNNNYYKGIGMSKYGNPNLTWETTTEFNIGMDLGFLKGRINASVEYYHHNIKNLLQAKKKLMSYNEIAYMPVNDGETQGSGIEFTLNTVNIKNKNFTWTTDLTLSHYVDRWKKRPEGWAPSYMAEKADDYIRSSYVYQTNGLIQVGQKVPAWQPGAVPGQMIVVNQGDASASDPKITAQYDYINQGSLDPAVSFGFNNTIRWKQFDFNIYFYGDISRLTPGSYYDDWSTGLLADVNNVSKKTLDVWRHDNQGSNVPSAIRDGSFSNTDYYFKKVSYMRCRNIMLGYTFKLPKASISKLRIYADVNNPFVISNYSGIDPETGAGKLSKNSNTGYYTSKSNLYAYPSVVSYTIGVDITF
jgi:TonB-linked SusC/RagA family outer membrane protein